MSTEDEVGTCKQRFKRVENFLRRVAFNLGNSPSRTEVKIISCIPIDVTDLQKKINDLEKEVREAKANDCEAPKSCHQPPMNHPQGTPVFTSRLIASPKYNTKKFCNSIKNVDTISVESSLCKECCSKQNQSNMSFICSPLSNTQPHQTEQCHVSCEPFNEEAKHCRPLERGKCLFRRRKRKKLMDEKTCPKTHLVYYTQAPSTPFNGKYINSIKRGPQLKPDIIKDYFSSILSKQYNPNCGFEEFSDTSHFTGPICRDLTNKQKYDSDVCSCCHGNFQNIDNYMAKKLSYNPVPTSFYNTDLYDMIPVKEYTNKIKKDYIHDRPAPTHTKNGINPLIVNYYHADEFTGFRNTKHIKSTHYSRVAKLQRQLYGNTSESSSVNCGQVYVRQNPQKIETLTRVKTTVPPSNIVKLNTVTNESKSIQLDVDFLNNKTEEMLNQIKSILQTVLAEIKTNTEIKRSMEDKPRKDAVVQKGSSQNNMQGCSTLLNSFSYNQTASNNTCPYFTPYQQKIPSGHLYCPAIHHPHVKYVQNLPFVISPLSGRHMCACNYKNSEEKAAITIATNTEGEVNIKQSNETNNLIREIYKSVALSVDYTGNSISEYEVFRSENSMSKSNIDRTVQSENTVNTVKTDKEIEALLDPCTTNAIVQTVYTDSSSQSDDIITTDVPQYRRDAVYNMHNNRTLYRVEERSIGSKFAAGGTVASYSDNESETTAVPPTRDTQKSKKGFFKLFFNSVKMKNKQQTESKLENTATSDTDSEDYETVDTDSVKLHRHTPGHRRQRPINIQVNGKKLRRAPYMEQEYRREWNEAFHEPNKGMPTESTKRSPYYRSYETRNVLIDNKNPADKQKNNKETKLSWLTKHKLGVEKLYSGELNVCEYCACESK